MKKINKFKVGDFVRIKGDVHDADIPPSRMGHLIEVAHAPNPDLSLFWMVHLTNGTRLKFHEMFLEHVE